MVSIHKLTVGQSRYYLDQAEGRVDAVESIGDGVEEYYAGGSEARGEWLGAGARELGLEGGVEGDLLRRVLCGESPAGEPLRSSAVPVKVAGFDMTYSAPKSVSVLFALGEPAVRDAVRAAHDRAMREGLKYMEHTAAAVRRGAGGERVEPAAGLIAAAFRHRTSRAGDPQLHTHCLVANLAQGPDRRWSALDGRRLYAQARASSFVYHAVLRSELERSVGVRWLSVRDGIAEIAGIPKPVLRAFSRRRADIEVALAERNASGARAAEAAALATRQPKELHASFDDLAHEWRTRAHELGFGIERIARTLGHRQRGRELSVADADRLFDNLAGPAGLTREKSTFGRRDVVQSLASQLPSDLPISANVLEALADRYVASDRVVALLPAGVDPEVRLSFRRRDGRVLPVARDEWVYSTPELLSLEQSLVKYALAGRRIGAGLAEDVAVRHAVDSRPTLGADQRTMVEQLCLGGDRIAVVVGKAGTGKTYALTAAREAWQASELPVLGVAVARRAANQLAADAAIATTSVAALTADLGRPGRSLPRGAVLVIDEASMLPTRHLAQLVDAVDRVDGKLVLVGDHRQLPELEAGGFFRALVQRGLAIELTENRRLRAVWERHALDLLRDGDPASAIAAYVAHDRVHVSDTSELARERLVAGWCRARTRGDALMIAPRRSDVADLNARARRRLQAAGELGRDAVSVADAQFAVGDEVVVKRNDLALGVTNGDRGRVVTGNAAEHRLTIRFRDRAVTLGRGFLETPTVHGEPALTHGYTVTCHVAQGLTVDCGFVLGDECLTSELGYAALSRGRSSNRLYLAERVEDPSSEFAPTPPPERNAVERLVAALSMSRANVLAIDAGRPDPVEQLDQERDELSRAHTLRVGIERGRWRPGRQRRLADALQRETAALWRVGELERTVAEQLHAELPFVGGHSFDEQVARVHDRNIERQLDRGLSRGLER